LVLRGQLQLGLNASTHEVTMEIDTRTSHDCTRFIHALSLRRSYGRDA
jgi:hypothetical protein